jgi:hypothetical protein
MADTTEDMTKMGTAAEDAAAKVDQLNANVEANKKSLEEQADAVEESANQLSTMSGMTNKAGLALNSFNDVTKSAGSLFNIFNRNVQELGVSLNTTKALTDKQTTQFALLGNAVLGARSSYAALAGTNFSGFKDQFEDLKKILTESPAGSAAATAIELRMKALALAGGSTSAEIAKLSKDGLLKLAESFVISADNALKLQAGFIGLSGKTGNLNEVFKLAGPNLENINILLEKQAEMMGTTAKATNTKKEVVEQYYSALGAVPGALTSMVASTKSGDSSVTMLTAAMKVAAGTGRDFTDIVDDLKLAFRDYGMTGENALRFSAQISDVTQNLGVELDTVKNALKGSSDAFKMFAFTGSAAANMSSGLADIMNHYGQALEATGLQGTQAVNVVSKMTNQISQMSLAQKSFLSQQTGGAGGLMGGFQIDKMIKEGDIAGVFEKVRQQMQKQFGRIVSLDEAATSESAANQMTRQMTMLKQGPLGKFAETDADAQNILAAFKEVESGGGGGATNMDILAKTMDRGTSVQEKSHSVTAKMGMDVADIRSKVDIATLNLFQKGGFTAGRGVETKPGEMEQNDDAVKSAEKLRASMYQATNLDKSKYTGSYAETSLTGNLTDTGGRGIVSAFENIKDSFKILPLSIKGVTDELMRAFSSGDISTAQEKNDLLKESIGNLKTTTTSDNTVALAEITKLENLSNTVNNAITSGAAVGVAANRSVSRSGMNPDGSTVSNDALGASRSEKQDFTFHHHITGFCLKCKQEMESGHQAKSVSPQAG